MLPGSSSGSRLIYDKCDKPPLMWITPRTDDHDDDGEGVSSTVSGLSDYNMARQAYSVVD